MPRIAEQRHIPKSLKKAFKEAQRDGWEVVVTSGNHLRWKPPTGKPVFTPSTPSDYRGMKNAISQLRRAGLNIQNP